MGSAAAHRPIVLGIDAPAPAPMTVAWAADEAARWDRPLRLVRAVSPPPYGFTGADWVGSLKEQHREGGVAVDRAALLARERHPGLEVTGETVEGVTDQVLCEESRRADLVVVGSRRLSHAEEWLSASSVTVPLSAQAHCPLVVVGAPEHSTQQPPYVVVGVDGSRSSAAAVDFAFDLAARRGAELRAVWVWRPPLILPTDRATAVQTLRRQLSEATAGHGDAQPDVRLTHDLLVGHPVEQLAAASAHALAVVVGRRGHGGFTGMRLGSVPHGLLHHARCPVVTVPPPADHPR
ncbi:universal stress protein [Streptomyces sp. NRRL B-24484]|uniref:universal stress protein n=1 Tax=Streptomyces sp. NRRL B-24484 TaxID=1463833 RepID=UPI0004BE5F6C|nr:universal stress protein [Streptomyces sp. NRRL B-24484]